MQLTHCHSVSGPDSGVFARLDALTFARRPRLMWLLAFGTLVQVTVLARMGADGLLISSLGGLVGLVVTAVFVVYRWRSDNARPSLGKERLWMLAVLVALSLALIPHFGVLALVAVGYLAIGGLALCIFRGAIQLILSLKPTLVRILPRRLLSGASTSVIPSRTDSSRRPPRNPPTA